MKPILENDPEYKCVINAPCFQMLSIEETELVKRSKTQVLFRKGENLTKQGTFSSYILFIIDGLARQYLESEGDKGFNLRIIMPGEFVGLSAVFTKNTFDCSSIAITDCKAILVEKEAFANLARQNGMFGFNIMKRYCTQNSDLFDKLQKIMYKQMNGRMADTLIYLNEVKNSYPEIFQLLSRKEIADFAGISTESAVKLLKSFEKDGIIELKNKGVRVISLNTLIDISRRG